MPTCIAVAAYRVAPDAPPIDMREEVWAFALDQRAFGRGRLVVAFTDGQGQLLRLVHAELPNPPELALLACIDFGGAGAPAAVAFCDERMVEGPPPPGLADTFALQQKIASEAGIHLVDWLACDEEMVRSSKLALFPDAEWWDVP